MGSGLSSPLGVGSILLLIIGISMAIAGIVLIIQNQNKPKPWFIWLLLIGGNFLAFAGSVLLAIALSDNSTYLSFQ